MDGKMDSKADLAYQYLKERIISGSYAPLSSISEKEIRLELDTSRTPVREALLRLQDLGFVYIYPSKGTIVSELSRELIEEMYETRVLNEATANISASRYCDAECLRDLRQKFLSGPKTPSDGGSREFYIALDDALHEHLLSCCINRFVRRSLQMVYEHNRRLRRFALGAISVTEHVALIDAVLSGDEAQIRKATQDHLEGSYAQTIKALERGELRFLHGGKTAI